MTSKSDLTLVVGKEKGKKKKKLSYFRLVQQEFKKISWPQKQQLVTYTKVVLASTFLTGLMIYATDILLRLSMSAFAKISRMIIG